MVLFLPNVLALAPVARTTICQEHLHQAVVLQVPPAIHPAVPAIAGTAELRFNACIAPLPPTAYPPPMILAVTVPAPATMHTATASVIATQQQWNL